MTAQDLDADLNTLYDAALAFGENWRRPLDELAAERFPKAEDAYRQRLVESVQACRTEIEEYVASVYTEDETVGAVIAEAHAWVARQYPWMTEANVRHGVSQGGYYAWHG